MNDNEICNMIYDNIIIEHKDYDLANMRVMAVIEDNITYILTSVKYWKDNKLYEKIFRNKLNGDVNE